MRLALPFLLLCCNPIAAQDVPMPGPVGREQARAVYDATNGRLFLSADRVVAHIFVSRNPPLDLIAIEPLPEGVWAVLSGVSGAGAVITVSGYVENWQVGSIRQHIPFADLSFDFIGNVTSYVVTTKCNDSSGWFVCVPETSSSIYTALIGLLAIGRCRGCQLPF
jgi:hypothetical protein